MIEESPAKRQKVDTRRNLKMEKEWMRERRFQAGSSFLDDQLDKYEAVTLPTEASAFEWWSTTGRSLCGLILPVAQRVLPMQATTCQSERTFSQTRRILRWDRSGLDGGKL